MKKKAKFTDEMSEKEIHAMIDKAFDDWNDMAQNGCSDPSWPDGTNLNHVRNHIIYYRSILEERRRDEEEVQMSLFPVELDADFENTALRPLPPIVPDSYMVPDCLYSKRLDNSVMYQNRLVWGKCRGEYRA